jgi:hypothetical protein
MDDCTIDADGGKWTDQRSISVEVDAFDDGFRHRSTVGDIPSMRGKYVQTMQGMEAAGLRWGLRLRIADVPEHHRDNGDQCSCEK